MLGKSSGRRDKSLYNRATHRSTSGSREHNSIIKEKPKKWEYVVRKTLGRGTFGMVYLATLATSGVLVAVKKVLQDDNYKNRQYEIIKEMDHPNVVKLHHSYFLKQPDPDNPDSHQVYLYLIMEYIPEDLHRITKYFHQEGRFPNILIKVYSFQIFKALAYFQIHNVCHRDIKPRNILIDLSTHILRICDFGSAKKLVKGESNLSYVCSRYYRAPELQMGNQQYTLKSDMWSAAAVIAEMVLNTPMFLSDSSVDHMASIICKLGTPSMYEMELLNPNAVEYYQMIPKFKARSWKSLLPRCDQQLRDLLSKILVYNPSKRLSPAQAMTHPYFKELKGVKINGKELKFLFQFSEDQKIMYKQFQELV